MICMISRCISAFGFAQVTNDGCKFGTTAAVYTAQKMKFSIKDFFSKCDRIRKLKKSLMENFIFCVMLAVNSV